MSTKHTGQLADTGSKHYANKQNILKPPDVIVEYNKTMRGVDNVSRVVIPYSIHRKGLKWYRKIAELFIELAVYNAHTLWKLSNGFNKTQLQFRMDLVKDIVTYHLSGTRAFQSGQKPAGDANPFRLIGKHFIRLIMVRGGEKRKRRRCVGRRNDCSYECSQCNVVLCLTP
jgi:hypothetical protein